ncbi:LysR family transcriptional regulator substrate-binding protein [Clostridium sp. Marseille-P2415]|uniref:LysR family transcriptional regulator substrate-binding protein n=1 Tax=Clostridium sp. Marseille-P2415 TaxID=1805471 RepID=UPI000988440A
MIIYDICSSTQKQIDEWWQQQYDRPPYISMTTTFIDSAWQMVRQGLGYAVCFLSPVQAESLDLCKCTMADQFGNPVKRTTYFLYHDKKELPDYVKSFIQMILDDLSGHSSN